MDFINFYLNKKTDDQDRTLDSILRMDDSQFENKHDYIQIIFPLQEKSNFNSSAPLISEEEIQEFKINKEIRSNVFLSVQRFLKFLGLNIQNELIIFNQDWKEKSYNWLNYRNHNYLRITRLLKFLMMIGMKDLAKNIFDMLKEIYTINKLKIGEETYLFWLNATI
jgi:hypothetical protein